MAYSNKHKMFLQFLFKRGLLNAHEAKDTIVQLFQNKSVADVVSDINHQLRPLKMTVNCVTCEHTGEKYWMLTSNSCSDLGRFQTEFSKAQLAYMREIITEIITSEDKCFSSSNCLNLCSKIDMKLLKTNTAAFLNDMVDRKWLHLADGHYYLGVRSIGELMPYFKQTYEETFLTCLLCHETIFYGKKCPHCQSMSHVHCLKRYESITKTLECPSCRATLTLGYETSNSAKADVNDENTDEDISQDAQ